MSTVADHAANQAAALARIEAAFTGLTADIAWMKARITALEGGNPPPPPPPPPEGVLAELSDSSAAGMDKRLGPKAPAGMVVPEVWLRPKTASVGLARSFFSEGLGAQTTEEYDYGSTEAQFVIAADLPLVITPKVNSGVGVLRFRTEEHGEGMVSEFPAVAWNGADAAIPDGATQGHVQFGLGDKIGRPIAVTRARINRYDGGLVLYDTSRGGPAYIGTVGSQTAFSPWSGLELPAGKIPLSICLTSQNELALVGVHDIATGKGQVGLVYVWGGMDAQQDAVGFGLPADWLTTHPGLMHPGVVTGMKIAGWVDLPIQFPTDLSAACERNAGGNRIEGPDGNAAYLSVWDLSTQGGRDAFMAKNGGWISKWGKACAISKHENKAVMIDLTSIFQGLRDQYFTTQANYDATRPVNPDLEWWKLYWAPGGVNANIPENFPYGLSFKTAWTPTVGAVIAVNRPTSVLMAENGTASVAIGSEDGNVRFFKFDGSPDGSVTVGANVTSIRDDKYNFGMNRGAMVVVSRGNRSVSLIDKMGTGAQVIQTLQDTRLLDPVAAEVGDTHGLEFRYVTICDYDGKKVINYRLSELVLVTQGGQRFGMGPDGTAPAECGGWLDVPGKPFAVAGTNVN